MNKNIVVGAKVMYQFYNDVEGVHYGEINYAKILKIDNNPDNNRPYTIEHRYFGVATIKKIEIIGVA